MQSAGYLSQIGRTRVCALSDTEVWKIVERDPRYDVSSWGRVRSWCGRGRHAQSRAKVARICTLRPHRQGYWVVRLGTVTQYVHQLVATAFIGPRPAGQETRHLNDVNTDNRPENLRYGTRRENRIDAYRNGCYTPEQRTGMARHAALAQQEQRRARA